MNSKKAGGLFLTVVIVNITLVILLSLFSGKITLGIFASLLVSQMVVVIPGLLFILAARIPLREVFVLRKLKWATIPMLILFTYLIMPLITVVNAFSLFFTDNAALALSESMSAYPFWASFFMVALLGPVLEELFFRGILHSGFRKSANAMQAAVISAVLFGMMHMNFNQALYAFVLGMILAVLKEVTGSLLAPILVHIVFNSNSVFLMYFSKLVTGNGKMTEVPVIDDRMLIVVICVYAVIALATCAIAFCVLLWIAEHEGYGQRLKAIWGERQQEKGKIIHIPLLVAMILCIVYMFLSI